MDISQTDIASAKAIGEASVVDSEQMEHIGMHVVHC